MKKVVSMIVLAAILIQSAFLSVTVMGSGNGSAMGEFIRIMESANNNNEANIKYGYVERAMLADVNSDEVYELLTIDEGTANNGAKQVVKCQLYSFTGNVLRSSNVVYDIMLPGAGIFDGKVDMFIGDGSITFAERFSQGAASDGSELPDLVGYNKFNFSASGEISEEKGEVYPENLNAGETMFSVDGTYVHYGNGFKTREEIIAQLKKEQVVSQKSVYSGLKNITGELSSEELLKIQNIASVVPGKKDAVKIYELSENDVITLIEEIAYNPSYRNTFENVETEYDHNAGGNLKLVRFSEAEKLISRLFNMNINLKNFYSGNSDWITAPSELNTVDERALNLQKNREARMFATGEGLPVTVSVIDSVYELDEKNVLVLYNRVTYSGDKYFYDNTKFLKNADELGITYFDENMFTYAILGRRAENSDYYMIEQGGCDFPEVSAIKEEVSKLSSDEKRTGEKSGENADGAKTENEETDEKTIILLSVASGIMLILIAVIVLVIIKRNKNLRA